MNSHIFPIILSCIILSSGTAAAQPRKFFEEHCYSCHDERNKKGGLDLAALTAEPADLENFARWLKIHDRIESGEMPPRTKDRPPAAETAAAVKSLHDMLVKAERVRSADHVCNRP